ncbi:glycosyl hydrolase family 8 [Tahibacter caeni]|uniref:glycosyl hydrolase family 8 n=1 Tax=Tahibacter caeni TaxID=1453545 RepID=UPI00214895C2|nr:glycosyl hydrolase family 8 [Tahibacter caeni]
MRALLCFALSGLAAAAAAQTPVFPFPQHVNYAFGSLRPNHRTQAQLDQDVRDAYARWKSAYLRSAGTDGSGNALYRVLCDTDGAGNTVSEGQGYGLVVVALMAGHEPDAAAIAAGLWRYADLHPSGIDARLMSWNISAAGQVQEGNDSAFDGDNDIALGLLIAAAQWPAGTPVDFRARALEVIAGQSASVLGPASALPLLGDWVAPDGATYNQYSVRPSDFMPAHALNFAVASGAPVWRQSIAAMHAAVEHLQTTYAPATGLLPDFSVRESAASTQLKPAPANFLEGPHDGHYDYNAGRVPWRLATQALLHADADSARQARRIALWSAVAAGGVATNIRPGYLLDGTPITTSYFTSFFAAPLGVAAMTSPGQQSWLNAIYDSVRTRQEGYYEDSVALLSLLVMSGTYWDPVAIDRIFADGVQRIAP